jgi:hypothetical protein
MTEKTMVPLQAPAGAGLLTPTAGHAAGLETPGLGGKGFFKEGSAPKARAAQIPGARAGRGKVAEDEGSLMEAVRLQETPTMMLLVQTSLSIAIDAPERSTVEARNTAYGKLLESRLHAADRFGSRHVQTLNPCEKNKEVQAARPAVRECACQASTFEIFDETVGAEDVVDAEGGVDLMDVQHGIINSGNARLAEKKIEEYVKVRGAILKSRLSCSSASMLLLASC